MLIQWLDENQGPSPQPSICVSAKMLIQWLDGPLASLAQALYALEPSSPATELALERRVPKTPATAGATGRKGPRSPAPVEPQSPSTASAVAKTVCFLISMRLALQSPLATLPPVPPAVNTLARRSNRIALQALNAIVRPSKKGEVLTMQKLGELASDGKPKKDADGKEFDKFITSIMKPKHFAAVRDIFPFARHLSDSELLVAAQAASSTAFA